MVNYWNINNVIIIIIRLLYNLIFSSRASPILITMFDSCIREPTHHSTSIQDHKYEDDDLNNNINNNNDNNNQEISHNKNNSELNLEVGLKENGKMFEEYDGDVDSPARTSY